MRWLNYHHLYYFWVVATKGGVTEASKELNLAQPTISAQIKTFEESLGEKLFEKDGRKLKLTQSGQVALRYAEEIFALGTELFEVVEGKISEKPEVLRIGISEVVPKHMAHSIIAPIFNTDNSNTRAPKIICFEDTTENLLAELAIKHLDIIISDSPIPTNVKVKAYNHPIGESEVSFVATEELIKKYKKPFPQCLHGAPVMLPLTSISIRRDIDKWFEDVGVTPNIVGEFQDRALVKIFAKNGHAFVPVPAVLEDDICKEFNLNSVGLCKGVKEKFFLISIERKIKHPAVVKIIQEAPKVLKR